MLQHLRQLRYHQPQLEKSAGFSEAAVFIPLIKSANGFELLFEVRAVQLKRQPGEICFPGGKVEPQDSSVVETALRETQEELNLNAGDLNVFGQLDYFASPLGLYIYPVCGEIINPQRINPHPSEVAEIFQVPLQWFIDTPPLIGYSEVGTRPGKNFPLNLFPGKNPDWQKRSEHPVLFYHWQDRIIWGLTAQIIHAFLQQSGLKSSIISTV